MQNKILKDLLVIELASVLAGPTVGMFFAELGARVIKIENPKTGGDITRQWKLPSEKEEEQSAYYSSCNYGKEVVFLDVGKDRKALLEWIEKADILIHNFKFGDAEKFELSYEHLKAINPSLIYASLTGFGENSERIAYDVVLQAESGFMGMNGLPDDPPVKMPVALIDILSAHQLKEGILLALYQRAKTGRGADITCSLFDAAVGSLANQATNWLMAKHIPQRMGSLHPNIAPYGEQFVCADGKRVVLAIGSDRQFEQLLQLLQLQHLLLEEKYATNKKRVENRLELAQHLEKGINAWERATFIQACIQAKIPAGAIRNMKEVFELPDAEALILEEGGTKRPKTVSFKIR